MKEKADCKPRRKNRRYKLDIRPCSTMFVQPPPPLLLVTQAPDAGPKPK